MSDEPDEVIQGAMDKSILKKLAWQPMHGSPWVANRLVRALPLATRARCSSHGEGCSVLG